MPFCFVQFDPIPASFSDFHLFSQSRLCGQYPGFHFAAQIIRPIPGQAVCPVRQMGAIKKPQPAPRRADFGIKWASIPNELLGPLAQFAGHRIAASIQVSPHNLFCGIFFFCANESYTIDRHRDPFLIFVLGPIGLSVGNISNGFAQREIPIRSFPPLLCISLPTRCQTASRRLFYDGLFPIAATELAERRQLYR